MSKALSKSSYLDNNLHNKMGRHPYKKRNQTVAITRPSIVEVQRFPPTKYETPVMTLKNFPSSIVNGVTREGGLYSLTLKSINCAKYVENNDNMRRVFKKRSLEVPKISNLNRNDLLERLSKDVEKERESKVDLHKAENDKITALNKEWDSLLKTNTDLSEHNDRLLKNIESGGKKFRFIENKYSFANIANPNLRVEKIEGVKNTAEYEQSATNVETEAVVVLQDNDILQDAEEANEGAAILDQLQAYQDDEVAEAVPNDLYTQ